MAAGIPVDKALPSGISKNDLPGIKNDMSRPLNFFGQPPTVPGNDARENRNKSFFDLLDEPSLDIRGPRPQQKDGASRVDPGAAPRSSAPDDGKTQEQKAIKRFRSKLPKPGPTLEEALIKDPRGWTEEEAEEVRRFYLRSFDGGPDTRAIEAMRERRDSHVNTPHLPPRMVADLMPKTPLPATAPGGIDLGQAMADLADGLARKAAADGLGPVVRGLQTGLPFIEPRAERLHGPPRDGVALAFAPAGLKVDGIPGPKTRAATRRAVAALGPEAVAGAAGVGRFEDTLRQRPLTPAALAGAADALFAWPRPGRMGYGPARNLQNGINDLGREALGSGWPDLAVDGAIGPATVAAVERLNTLYKQGTVARYLGEAFAII